jgi:hypothetical protein
MKGPLMAGRFRFSAVLLCVGILLSGCQIHFAQGAAGPQAWIDAPLDHSVFPLGPVQVVSHGADLGGIAQIELSANGVVIPPDSQPGGGQGLMTQDQVWHPQAPGEYELRVRARNNAGAWSPYASEIVFIRGSAASVPRPGAPTPTLSATPTFTPVASPTATLTLTPAGAATGGVSVDRISADLIYIGKASCGPLDVTIVARAAAPQGITVVALFYRFQYDGAPAGFQNAAMDPIGGDLYQYKLNPTSVLGGVPFDQATLQYQIVVQQKDGDTSIRTPVLADIAVQACGPVAPAPGPAPDCSSYTDKRTCVANGCKWVPGTGIVATFTCKKP